MVVLLECAPWRGLIVSVLPIANQSRARERGFASFADNFLNDYSGVKNITLASNRYGRSGFTLRRFALR
jgi:hypothetical protein